MIHFVGAGPGAPDLITVRGQKFLAEADVIIYAGSLVNPELLSVAKESCRIHDSAYMTLEEVLQVMEKAEEQGLTTVRLHTGDPSVYGAIREQMEGLEKRGIAYDVTPGVSSFCGAAAALGMEYTLPGISQSVILTRMEGRTKVPEKESIESFAAHRATVGASYVYFPSATVEMVGYLTMTLIASFLLRWAEKKMDGSGNYELVQEDQLTMTAGTYRHPDRGTPFDERSKEYENGEKEAE